MRTEWGINAGLSTTVVINQFVLHSKSQITDWIKQKYQNNDYINVFMFVFIIHEGLFSFVLTSYVFAVFI